jgi:hypothetical protein
MKEDSAGARERVGYVKNGRPNFFDDPVNDKLLAMVMALLGEVSVLRERVDTHERLAARHGLVTAMDIEAFVADEDARQAMLERVLSVLSEDVTRLRHSG